MSTPVDAYRRQQGLGLDVGGYHPDPQVMAWIEQAAAEAHADPVALLATALQESGGKLHGPAGDKGTSYSTFQLHEGGALGNHPPSWAATYAAFLNRAREFARLQVHGGPGAAAVQRPLSAGLYARGVNSLLPVARELLGRSAPVRQGATPTIPAAPSSSELTPIERIAGNDPFAQAQFLDAILNPRSGADSLLGLVQQPRVDSAPPGGPAVSPPGGRAPSSTKPMPLTPGGGWAGTQALAHVMEQIGASNGLKIISEKRPTVHTASGGISDHWSGNKTAYAYDLSNGSRPTPQMDATALAIATRLGVADKWRKQGQAGVLNVNIGGYRYQMLYRTLVGGNHFNHVHIGVRKL